MLPTILVSSICSVLSMAIKDVPYGSIGISTLNAFNSFTLALVTYLKLDAKAEAHKTSSYQLDKLQLQCEFYSGKVQMYGEHNDLDKIKEFVDTVEKKIAEIKDVNQFIIPEIIRIRLEYFYNCNVFNVLREKNAEITKNSQELLLILNTIKFTGETDSLIQRREYLINKIIEYRNLTSELNKKFKDKIIEYDNVVRNRWWFGWLMCLRT